MIVKVCGITNEADALAAVEAGADAIGFNFWPKSPRYVEAQPWMAALPVVKVGIYVGEADPVDWLDVAQVYGRNVTTQIRTWRGVKPGDPLEDAEAFVMDVSEGTGKTFDWTLAAGLPARIVLAGGLDASNVQRAIRVAKPWGVDACSKIEASPGRKDHTRMREFIVSAREGFSAA